MARTSVQMATALLLLFSITAIAATGASNRRRPPIILPLHHSSHTNISRRQPLGSNYDHDMRRLRKSEPPHHHSARMRLYDDLLSNGYYTTRLWIGTPPQEFALIVDTGSTVTYVPCSNCKKCGKHQDPRFRPDASSTYQPVKCSINCNCDSKGRQCIYERRYAEMSTSSGVLGEDIISFGNESELAPQRAVFGCEEVETGDLYRQHADGIVGLGRGRLSIMDQIVDKDVISDSFSLCYGGMDVGGGAMVLGGISPPPGMVFAHSDPYRSPYYNIDLKEIHVAGEPLKLKPKIFDGNHGTVLDSGTTYAYLPEEAFVAFKDAITKKSRLVKQIHGPDPNYNDICFAGAGRDVTHLADTFPEVNMVFGNGQKLSLTPENYLFRHTKVSGAYCIGIFPNRNDPTTLLGGILVRNTLVTYNRENDTIGFLKTNCSELHKRLQSPDAPAPPPLDSYRHNTSSGTAPTIAPSGYHQNSFPGEFRIGVITFDMSLSINNSNTKPNFTELAEFIAHELEVTASQVHLVNISSKGNVYDVEWAIFPAAASAYISNAAAMNIIMRLRDHHMQLPERFGSYQLVEWKIKPQMDQTWWQQHSSAVVAGIIVSLVISLSTTGIWLVWRKRRGIGNYEPVREQELQPLEDGPTDATHTTLN